MPFICVIQTHNVQFSFFFLSYSGYTIDALITVAANDSFDFNFVINELYNLLLVLENVQTTITSIQRFGKMKRNRILFVLITALINEQMAVLLIAPVLTSICGQSLKLVPLIHHIHASNVVVEVLIPVEGTGNQLQPHAPPTMCCVL